MGGRREYMGGGIMVKKWPVELMWTGVVVLGLPLY